MQGEKHPQSVAGKYWIDCEGCLAHGICADLAPNNFRYNEEGGFRYNEEGGVSWSYFIYKQPETEEEERQCHEALIACPMAVIHDDGDQSAA